jgi:CBS domain-containing protein
VSKEVLMNAQASVLLQRKDGEVAVIPSAATLADAAANLAEYNVGALVVSDDGEVVTGMLSERDVVRCLARSGADALTVSVREVMSRDVTTCAPETTVDKLMATMTRTRIRHVPVIEDGRLLGIVSIGDVVQNRVSDLETEAETLREYVAGSY